MLVSVAGKAGFVLVLCGRHRSGDVEGGFL